MTNDREPRNGDGGASFFWYDLETTGTNLRADRIVQFAGIRTDLELNEVDLPFSTYVKCPVDVLPDPFACAVTGLTPQRINRDGMNELEAYVAINRCFAQPQTCVAGFNSLRFDDEFIRYGFFRHFIDPYAREWQGGNSRWDIIDLARAAAALRPEGIEWPTEEGLPTFRLGELAAANGIAHAGAHDALSDVRATVDLARLLRAKQPRLFDYYLKLRDRGQLQRRLRPERSKLSLHVSRMFARERGCIAPIVPLAWHPRNRNSVIVADVGRDIRPLIEWNPDRLRDALFGRDVEERPPLKEVRFNRCPFVAPLATLRATDAERLVIDVAAARRRADELLAAAGIADKIASLYADRASSRVYDADASLYDGFIEDDDRARCGDVLSQLLDGVASPGVVFSDERLNELLFRLRARRDESTLSAAERARWQLWLKAKLVDGDDSVMTLARFRESIDRLGAPAELIEELREHANRVERRVAGLGASAA
ncbi:MAG TPA: exodeoxyribonuclease I [Pseudomonadales bacterium]